MQARTTPGWHTAQWGTWGWAETILKLVALAAGILAFFQASGDLIIGNHPRLAAVILLALLTLGSLFQLYIRFTQRETISMGFAVLNLLGHVGLLIALLRAPDLREYALVFGVFYTLGQLVKIQFLRVTGYTEGGATTRAMLMVTAVMTVLYALVAILVLV